MRLGQTSAVYLIASIVTSIVGFLATIYFTRLLGEEIYGFFAITLALVSWLGIIKSVGFGKAIVKRMSEGEEPDAYFFAGLTTKAVLTAIIAIGVLVFRDTVNAYVGQPVAEFVVLLLIVSIFSGLINNALQGTHRVHLYAVFGTGKEMGRAVFMVSLVYLGWELTGMLLGHAIGTAVIILVGLYVVRPHPIIPKRRHFVDLFDFAKWSWLGSMRKKSFSSADIIVLGLFVPAGLTGVYAVAYTLAQFLDIFGSAIKNTLFPEMSKRSTNDDMSMVADLTNDALAFAGMFLIPGVVGAAILGDRLMLVYGPGFDIGHWILVLLIVALIGYTYTKQLLNTLNAIDRPDLAFRANGVFIVGNIGLNLVLVYTIGWFGAAIATALSAAIGLVFSYYYVRQYVRVRIPFGEIARQGIAAMVMGPIVLVGRQYGEGTIIAAFNEAFMLLLVGVGAAVYFAILLVISRRFRTTVQDNLPFDVARMQVRE